MSKPALDGSLNHPWAHPEAKPGFSRPDYPPLFLEPIRKFLDHRVGPHALGDLLDLLLRLRAVPVDRDLEILPLPDVPHRPISHLPERALDRLPLRIEHTLLQRNINVSFHGCRDY